MRGLFLAESVRATGIIVTHGQNALRRSDVKQITGANIAKRTGCARPGGCTAASRRERAERPAVGSRRAGTGEPGGKRRIQLKVSVVLE